MSRPSPFVFCFRVVFFALSGLEFLKRAKHFVDVYDAIGKFRMWKCIALFHSCGSVIR